MTTRDFISLWVGNGILFAAIQAIAIKWLNFINKLIAIAVVPLL